MYSDCYNPQRMCVCVCMYVCAYTHKGREGTKNVSRNKSVTKEFMLTRNGSATLINEEDASYYYFFNLGD